MGDDDDGHALFVQLLEDTHDIFAGLRVQGAGRFVGQQQTGAVDQGTGNGDALLLTAGEFIGAVVGAFPQADTGERFQRHLGGVAGRDAGVEERQLNLTLGAGAGEQVKALEDETDFPVAHGG